MPPFHVPKKNDITDRIDSILALFISSLPSNSSNSFEWSQFVWLFYFWFRRTLRVRVRTVRIGRIVWTNCFRIRRTLSLRSEFFLFRFHFLRRLYIILPSRLRIQSRNVVLFLR